MYCAYCLAARINLQLSSSIGSHFIFSILQANGDYSPMKMLVDNLKSKNVKSADDRKRRSEDPVPYKKKHSSPSSSSSDRYEDIQVHYVFLQL